MGCTDCTIVVGVAGAVISVEACERVRLACCCGRLRVSNCVDSVFFLYTPQPPLLCGDTRGLRFAPFNSAYPLLLRHLAILGFDENESERDQRRGDGGHEVVGDGNACEGSSGDGDIVTTVALTASANRWNEALEIVGDRVSAAVSSLATVPKADLHVEGKEDPPMDRQFDTARNHYSDTQARATGDQHSTCNRSSSNSSGGSKGSSNGGSGATIFVSGGGSESVEDRPPVASASLLSPQEFYHIAVPVRLKSTEQSSSDPDDTTGRGGWAEAFPVVPLPPAYAAAMAEKALAVEKLQDTLESTAQYHGVSEGATAATSTGTRPDVAALHEAVEAHFKVYTRERTYGERGTLHVSTYPYTIKALQLSSFSCKQHLVRVFPNNSQNSCTMLVFVMSGMVEPNG